MNKLPSEDAYAPPHDPLSLEQLLRFFWRHKWTLIITGIVGFGLSVLATSFIPPSYKTSAVLFATQTNSSRKLLEEQQFGFDIHADRLIQILESDRVRDSVIKRFDLVNHYGIDKNELNWRDQLMAEYHTRIRFSRTIYMSVVVEVIDNEPEMGADIANAIIDMVDFVRAEILRENSGKTLEWLESEYLAKLEEVKAARDSLEDAKGSSRSRREGTLSGSLNSVESRISNLESERTKIEQKYGTRYFDAVLSNLTDELERGMLNEAFLEAKLKMLEKEGAGDSTRTRISVELQGVKAKINLTENRIKELQPGAARHHQITERLAQVRQEEQLFNSELNRLQVLPEIDGADLGVEIARNKFEWDLVLLNEIKKDYERALAVHQDPLPETYKVSRALPSYNKHAPVLWLNALIGTMFPLLFVTFLLILRDRFGKKNS